jgi:alpha-L-fucosidase
MKARVKEIRERTDWFMAARFGMFIHWGLYAIPARGEWVRGTEEMPTERYMEYFREFAPDRYDPRAWARAAKQAGMDYAVMTAKHHDGFCLFDSALTEFKATNTGAKRDLIAEYLEAFRAEGLKVGIYYSLIDWHHKDYPHFGDRAHPMRNNEEYKGKEHVFDRYLEYMHGQVRELCTNYGKIDIFWFDFSYDNLTGEAWRATDLVEMVRQYQPTAIMDNRLEVSGDSSGSTLLTGDPTVYSGDFVSPEQIIPPGGIADVNGDWVPWEACITMNNSWGYNANDHQWKSSKQIVRKLVECVSKRGNLLLNVGPTSRGEIPEPSLRVLSEIGEWMEKNGPSVRGCGPSSLGKPDWGYFTQKGNRLFCHLFDGNFGPTAIDIPKAKVKSIRLHADGSELQPIESWATSLWADRLFVNFGPDPIGSYPLPDDVDTVVEIEFVD